MLLCNFYYNYSKLYANCKFFLILVLADIKTHMVTKRQATKSVYFYHFLTKAPMSFPLVENQKHS